MCSIHGTCGLVRVHFTYMWMISALVSIIFPVRCLGCGASGSSLCNRCIRLAKKSLDAPHPYTVSAFDFKDPLVRRAIHSLKYYHRRDIVRPLALELANVIREECQQTKRSSFSVRNWTLVPVPMPAARKLIRGYNQAELIANELGRALALPVATNLLLRSHAPKRQVRTPDRTTRLNNQKGSFTVTEDLTGVHVMLIDDVTTSGSTLAEARKALFSKNAASVVAATLAH